MANDILSKVKDVASDAEKAKKVVTENYDTVKNVAEKAKSVLDDNGDKAVDQGMKIVDSIVGKK